MQRYWLAMFQTAIKSFLFLIEMVCNGYAPDERDDEVIIILEGPDGELMARAVIRRTAAESRTRDTLRARAMFASMIISFISEVVIPVMMNWTSPLPQGAAAQFWFVKILMFCLFMFSRNL